MIQMIKITLESVYIRLTPRAQNVNFMISFYILSKKAAFTTTDFLFHSITTSCTFRSQETPLITAQSDQRLHVAPPALNPQGASSRLNQVNLNRQLPPLTHAFRPTNNSSTQRLPPLAPAAPKPNMTYTPRFPLSSEASQPDNVKSAPRFPVPSQANPTTNINFVPQHSQSTQALPNPNINSVAQPPVVDPTPTLDHIPSEKAEELRDRLFKLTSDYQRLYSTFMSSGDASPNAARWNSIDIDLPYLFEVRQQVINFLVATKRSEKGEEVKDVQGFKESQKPFFKSLEDAVGVAVERLTWLRRNLEGPDGYAYPHQNWYYQVIGNNPRSNGLSPAKESEGVEEENAGNSEQAGRAGDAGESIDKATRHGDEHGNLISPSLDSEDEREMQAEKQMRM
ncbi:hypothetical protein BOTNAR_0101g00130 [Botryotinia narcissicola]|uniref:Uncharacterized protein n=1 Tax=Botryotinia narcissicola TaxID=278944 RepID=A0A4Z1IP41_9HELO|nr:hypothetical protein BOTNAR_0101g00130 [Botryotinia narcissicola]